MPSGPGALWGCALDRADAISSIEIEGDEGFSAGSQYLFLSSVLSPQFVLICQACLV